MARFKIIFLLFALTGCLGPSSDDVSSLGSICEENSFEGAHFEVGKFELDIIYPAESDGAIQPESFILDFRVPVTEVTTKEPMTEAEFQVHTFENYDKIMEQQKEICGESEEDPRNSYPECQNFKRRRCDDRTYGGCITIPTGSDGYIYWQEEYRYPAPETLKWIRFERVISNLSGKVTIPFTVNPWLGEVAVSSKFLQLTKSESAHYLQSGQSLYRHDQVHRLGLKEKSELTLEEDLQQCRNRRSLDTIFKDLKQTDNPSLLYAPSIDFGAAFPSTGKDEFSLRLRIPIQLLNQNYDGGTVDSTVPLHGAQFKVTPLLLSRDGDQYQKLHQVDESLTQIVTLNTEGLLDAVTSISVPQQSQKHMTLALAITPVEESNIKSFYGLYDIHESSSQLSDVSDKLQLKVGSSGDSEKPQHLKIIKQQINIHRREFENIKKEKVPFMLEGSATEDLALKLSRIRFVRVKSSGAVCETPVKREVIYNIEFCLSNPQSGEQYRNTSVDVVIEDMKKDTNEKFFESVPCSKGDDQCWTTIRTDEEGCVAFPYTMDHFPYNLQEYLLKRITFQASDNAFHSKNRQYVVLNPWEYGFLTYQNVTDTYKDRERTLEKAQKRGTESQMWDDPSFKKADDRLKSIISSENLRPPRIRINEYRSSIIEPSYVVDPSLDITTVKNMQFLFQPSIVRTDSIGETIRQTPTVLPVGYWIMRVILAKGPQEIENTNIIRVKNLTDSFYNLLNPNKFLKLMNKNMNKKIALFDERERLSQDDSRREDIADIQNKISDLNLENAGILKRPLFNKTGQHSQYSLPPFQPSDYISHRDMVVKGENAVVSALVEQKIPTEFFRHLGSKNSLLIEFYPMDHRGLKHSSQCKLNIKESTFAVMKRCERGDEKENCHDLETPVHWGLFSVSEVSGSHIVWPVEKFNSAKTFNIEPLPYCMDANCSNINKQNLSLSEGISLEDNLFEDDVIKNKFYPLQAEGIDSVIDAKYQNLLDEGFRIVNAEDRFDKDQYQNFCQNVEQKFLSDDNINKRNVMASEELDDHRWNLCICDSNLEEEISDLDLQNGQTFLRSKIKKCKLLQNLALNSHSVSSPTELISSPMDVCDAKKTRSYLGNSDYSPVFHSYQKCICNPHSKWENKTERIARCFSQREGLSYVSSSEFIENLNYNINRYNNSEHRAKSNVDENNLLPFSSFDEYNKLGLEFLRQEEKRVSLMGDFKSSDISEMVQQGFENVENDLKKRSFLHAMCYYWFNQYYADHIDPEIIQNFYKYNMHDLAYLADTHVDRASDNELYSNAKETVQDVEKIAKNSNKLYEYLGFEQKDIKKPFKKLSQDHPFWRCFKNPLLFFHIERKVMIDKLNADQTQYKNGRIYTYIQSSSRGISNQVGWGVRESRQSKAGVSGKAGFSFVGSGLGVDVSSNVESTEGREQSNQRRATQDEIKSVTLAVNHISIDLGLDKYRSCLTIRPKSSAFNGITDDVFSDDLNQSLFSLSEDEKMKKELMKWPYKTLGLMICDTEEQKEPLVVPEDYYYIHQFFGGHSYEFMSRTIYHNRPFIEILRGQHTMDRYTYLLDRAAHHVYLNTSIPSYYDADHAPRNQFVEEAQIYKTLIPAFEESTIDRTGFYKGIYTYSPSGQEYYDPHVTAEQIARNKKREEDSNNWTQSLWGFSKKLACLLGHSDTYRITTTCD